MSDTVAPLRDVPIFADLADATLARIAGIGERCSVPAGAELFRQGELPKALHILLEGQVALSGTAPDGSVAVVEVVTPVDMFILAAVLTDAPYLMSARTIAPARLLLIPAAPLREIIASEAGLALRMLASLSMQYRKMVRQIKDLKLRSAAQRLGCFLLALASERGGEPKVVLPYDKQLLAARLGTTPEHLSRAFAALRAHGVEVSGMTVRISDLEALTAFSAPDEV
ncbi:MAG TPA: cyclic nucleotide-binding domain-containing protein [Stellaceae bacterium]|nr:cyclic nucleotide-binding domain-containing protein [Stellaceae bacterium]